MKNKINEEVKKAFKPEFLNRLDSVIVFHALTKDQIKQIVDLMLEVVYREVTAQDRKLEVTDAAKEFLGKEGFDPVYGARPLRRAIQRHVEDALAEELIRGNFEPGDTIIADSDGAKVFFKKKDKPKSVAPPQMEESKS
jgi:ATP-dependent Clp protease ATP-binding subunit ClpC